MHSHSSQGLKHGVFTSRGCTVRLGKNKTINRSLPSLGFCFPAWKTTKLNVICKWLSILRACEYLGCVLIVCGTAIPSCMQWWIFILDKSAVWNHAALLES